MLLLSIDSEALFGKHAYLSHVSALCLCRSCLPTVRQEAEHPFKFPVMFALSAITCPVLFTYFLVHLYLVLTARTSNECVHGFGKVRD